MEGKKKKERRKWGGREETAKEGKDVSLQLPRGGSVPHCRVSWEQ